MLLDQHPGITLSNPKEPDFFTNNWDKGLDWYRRCFARLDGVLLDASTSYSMGQTARSAEPACDARAVVVSQRIHQLRPDAKFIYMVRDPADRTFSAYWHDVRERGEKRSLRDLIGMDPAYLEPSCYFAQISRYLGYFDLSRFLLLRFEEFVRDPIAHARRCAEFLGVAPFTFAPERARNESFRYSALGRVIRDTVGLQWSKRLSTSFRTALPEPVYHSLKRVVARPLPRLSEEDRAWLTGLFEEDYAAFEALLRQRHSEMNPLTPPNREERPPITVPLDRETVLSSRQNDIASQPRNTGS